VKRYEGMFIFPERLKEDALEAAMEAVNNEIVKAGGTILATTRLGRRTFARRLKRETAGHYVVITFELDPSKLQAIEERWRLMPDLFRFLVLRAEALAEVAEGEAHGVAE